VFFTAPLDMKVSWYAPSPDGRGGFTANAIDVPGRYNFLQAAIYRLKLTNIPGNPEMELYPTLEVVPANHKTAAFLAHSAVPVSFTDYDLSQVASGNYVVKVIYLPDPQFQNLATTGPDELVSSQLEPGVDPIAEACRRGSILLVIRMGNIHLELPHSPPMDAPNPYNLHPQPGPGMVPGPHGAQGMMPGPGGMPFAGGMPPGVAGPGAMPPFGMAPGGPTMLPPGAAAGAPFGPPPGNPAFAPSAPVGPPAAVPAVPTSSGPATPVGKLPEKAPVMQATFKTPAALAGQTPPPPPSSPAALMSADRKP
jgi:hypothetical protein